MIDIHRHVLGCKHPLNKNLPAWNMEIDAQMMVEQGINYALLSLPVGSTPQITRQVNDMLAQYASYDSKHYGMLACLPFAEPDTILAEIEYAYEQLDAKGFILPTNVSGLYLGDERLGSAWLEELDRRHAVVLIHPVKPEPISESLYIKDPSIYEFPFDTTRAVMNLVYSGKIKKYSNIRWIVSHAGGTIPFLAYRLSQIAEENKASDLEAQEVVDTLKGLYYDVALSTSNEALTSLKSFLPPSHLLFGTDAPLRPEAGVKQSIAILDSTNIFTPEEKELIMYGTAQSLFPNVQYINKTIVPTPHTVGKR